MRRPLAIAVLALLAGQPTRFTAAAQVPLDGLPPARQHLLHHGYAAASASYQLALQQPGAQVRGYYQAAQAATTSPNVP